MTVTIFLMRHGQTVANVEEILIGREDTPFTTLGASQPAAVAAHLRAVPLSHIYASPMARTQRTANRVLQTLGQPVPMSEAVPLAEIDTGAFTGLSYAEIRQRRRGVKKTERYRFPCGESWAEMGARAIAFAKQLEGKHPKENVLLVTHAGIIAALVGHHFGEPIERFIRHRFNHDFLGRLTIRDGMFAQYEKIAGTVDEW